MKENNIDLNEIVKIEQMPIVFEQLEKIGTLIEESTKDLDKLECTEENKQEVKKRRTEINNTLKVLEDRRKEIKTKLLEPYNVFNEKYENECKTKLENASNVLKEKIDTIESEQLKEKETELRGFAEQHIISNNIQDIVKFEDIGLNITLSASIKSLKEQILYKIEKIVNDIKLIEQEEYREELLIEYKKNNFDYVDSKIIVNERHRKIDELKKQQEEKIEQEKQEEKIVEKVEEVVAPKEIIEDDEVITVQFTITDTKAKILKLRDYLKENEINYE